MKWNRIFFNGLKTGAALAITTAAAMAAASAVENGAPWAAINAVTHIVDGDEITQPNTFSPRSSLIGLAINTVAMVTWGVIYETSLAATSHASTPITGSAAAAAIYVTDYHLVPKACTPGIEKKLSRSGIGAAYAILAATLAISSFWNDYDDME